MHTGGLAGPCESQSCLCACYANVNVSSNCSVAPIIACEYRRPGRQRRRLNMLCFACFRMLPHLHNSCESQYPPSDPSLPIHANLNLRSPTPYIALCESRVPHSPSDLCEFQARDSQILKLCECRLTPHPSTHANVSQRTSHLSLRMRMSGQRATPCRAYATYNVHSMTCLTGHAAPRDALPYPAA